MYMDRSVVYDIAYSLLVAIAWWMLPFAQPAQDKTPVQSAKVRSDDRQQAPTDSTKVAAYSREPWVPRTKQSPQKLSIDNNRKDWTILQNIEQGLNHTEQK